MLPASTAGRWPAHVRSIYRGHVTNGYCIRTVGGDALQKPDETGLGMRPEYRCSMPVRQWWKEKSRASIYFRNSPTAGDQYWVTGCPSVGLEITRDMYISRRRARLDIDLSFLVDTCNFGSQHIHSLIRSSPSPCCCIVFDAVLYKLKRLTHTLFRH
jgi:hypothetical protein